VRHANIAPRPNFTRDRSVDGSTGPARDPTSPRSRQSIGAGYSEGMNKMPRAARARSALGGAVGSRRQRIQQGRATLGLGARLEDGVADHPIAPQITSEDGTNRAHGLEETLYQHVTLEPEQTKRYGAARL
jgi:hypothetical protein